MLNQVDNLTYKKKYFLFISEDSSVDANDRVAVAFNKFDADQDGYLSWEEFREVNMINF